MQFVKTRHLFASKTKLKLWANFLDIDRCQMLNYYSDGYMQKLCLKKVKETNFRTFFLLKSGERGAEQGPAKPGKEELQLMWYLSM